MKITLTGMPGCGKSSVAKIISEKLEIKSYDTDNMIEFETGSSINEIFNKFGENYFRKLERNLLEDIMNKDDFILSVGGGLPCFHNNMQLITENSISFYLYADISVLMNRLLYDTNNKMSRPLLKGYSENELTEYLKNTLNKRESYYKQAQYTVGAQNAAEEIYDLIKLNY